MKEQIRFFDSLHDPKQPLAPKLTEGIIKCPLCQCLFCTPHDFKLHMQTYNTDPIWHTEKLKRVHGNIEQNYI